MADKIKAKVKWFNTEKGYGFIDGPDGDVFIHYRAIEPGKEGFKNLSEGDEVEFLQHKSEKGYQAAELTILKRLDSFHSSPMRDLSVDEHTTSQQQQGLKSIA